MTLRPTGITLPAEARWLERAARRMQSPLPGGGRMTWRIWGQGPALVLLHGGAGSWLHWLRTIVAFADLGWQVVAPDLQGFGESDALPEGYTIDMVAETCAEGLRMIIGAGDCRLVGFSFGGVVAGHLAERLGPSARHLVLVGSGGMGARRPDMAPLVKWRGRPTDEQTAAHRRNLEILMIAEPQRITDDDVTLQAWNAEHARGVSRQFSRTDTLIQALRRARPTVDGIWGEKDATAFGALDERKDLLRGIDPTARLIRIPGAGHWVQHEASAVFNARLAKILARRGGLPLIPAAAGW